MRGDPVKPVPISISRPFWSVVIPCYNAARWLPESLGSVLKQDAGPEQMQILVVDDCSSSDDPREVVERIGHGRVEFHQQKTNVGKSRNFATGISLASGKWIHILHADDMVAGNFYGEIKRVIDSLPSVGAVFSESRYINESAIEVGSTGAVLTESGVIPNFESLQYTAQRIQTPSIVVSRNCYEQLGTFRSDLTLTEDWEMWLRIGLHFDVAFCTTTLAYYRIFDTNSSHKAGLDGKWFSDLERLAKATDEMVPAELKRRLKSVRDQEIAIFISSFLARLIHRRKRMAAIKCLAKTLTWSPSPTVLKRVAGILLRQLKVEFERR
jgi:glycosyltransferase involved in cell wall biosynthesis